GRGREPRLQVGQGGATRRRPPRRGRAGGTPPTRAAAGSRGARDARDEGVAMVDTSAVGATDEPFTMPVERGKIREFARATMSSSPEYLDAVAPIPPTFLTTVAFWSPPGQSVFSKVKMDLRRLLHGGQEYTFFGPPPI